MPSLSKVLLHCAFQTSVLRNGVRTISWITRPWRQPMPSDQSWLTPWTGSSFPSPNPPLEPRPTLTTSKELCWLASSCRFVKTKGHFNWVCLQHFNWIQTFCRSLLVDCSRCGRIGKLLHSDTQARGPCAPAVGLRGSVAQAGAAGVGGVPRVHSVREQLHENSLRNFPSSVSQSLYQLSVGCAMCTSRLEFRLLMAYDVMPHIGETNIIWLFFCYCSKSRVVWSHFKSLNPLKISTVVFLFFFFFSPTNIISVCLF